MTQQHPDEHRLSPQAGPMVTPRDLADLVHEAKAQVISDDGHFSLLDVIEVVEGRLRARPELLDPAAVAEVLVRTEDWKTTDRKPFGKDRRQATLINMSLFLAIEVEDRLPLASQRPEHITELAAIIDSFGFAPERRRACEAEAARLLDAICGGAALAAKAIVEQTFRRWRDEHPGSWLNDEEIIHQPSYLEMLRRPPEDAGHG